LKIEQLTFTRFVAAMSVVFFHFGGSIAFLKGSPWYQVFRAGSIAVSYFYTLSGFIMAVAYYRSEGKIDKTRYAIARFARIYPLYLLGLMAMVPIVLYVGNNGKKVLLFNLAMVQAWFPAYALTFNSPGWSLSVEVFFYLSLPFLLALLAKMSPRWMLLTAGALWLVSQVVHIYLLNSYYQPYPSLEHNLIYYNPLLHLNEFVVGLAIGIVFKRYHERWQLRPAVTFPGIVLSTGLICGLIMYWGAITTRLNLQMALTNGLIAPLFGVFILFLALDQSWFSRVMQHKWLVLLGEASYGVYILQEPLSQYFFYRFAPLTNWSDRTQSFLFPILLIVLSILVFRCFESPARFWIRQQGERLMGVRLIRKFPKDPLNTKSSP
jgi:peptidoglycan/LPS O-acetylase OafA/YrhL